MNLIITGATGTAGSAALQEALQAKDIEKVTVLTRRPLGFSHPKLVEVIHDDFNNYEKIKDALANHDGCLWCLGISQSGLSEAEYLQITYNYALAGAQAMGAVNPRFIFCFLSGQGADSKEKSHILFARVKGQTENALMALPHPRVFCFRPGFIHSPTSAPKTWLERWIAKPLAPFLYKFAPGLIISASGLGRAMIQIIRSKTGKSILENDDIFFLSKYET
jgi:uncharacterized protein YbjT (DUF2867 family)